VCWYLVLPHRARVCSRMGWSACCPWVCSPEHRCWPSVPWLSAQLGDGGKWHGRRLRENHPRARQYSRLAGSRPRPCRVSTQKPCSIRSSPPWRIVAPRNSARIASQGLRRTCDVSVPGRVRRTSTQRQSRSRHEQRWTYAGNVTRWRATVHPGLKWPLPGADRLCVGRTTGQVGRCGVGHCCRRQPRSTGGGFGQQDLPSTGGRNTRWTGTACGSPSFRRQSDARERSSPRTTCTRARTTYVHTPRARGGETLWLAR
jgi:hypothetical protein